MEILRTILREHNYTIVSLLESSLQLASEEIQLQGGLSRKQFYLAIESLKKVGAIKKHDNSYMLTDITLAILKHLHEIEEIEQKRLAIL
jgi:predicted transcriptional regulator